MTTDLASYIHMVSRSAAHTSYTEPVVIETSTGRTMYGTILLEPTGIWIMPVNTTSSFITSTLAPVFNRHHRSNSSSSSSSHHRQESVPHETRTYRNRPLTSTLIQEAGQDTVYLAWENIQMLVKGPSGHSEHIFAKGVANHTHPITLTLRTTITESSSTPTPTMTNPSTLSSDTFPLSPTPLSLSASIPFSSSSSLHSTTGTEILTLWVYQIPSHLYEQIIRLRQIYALRNLLKYIMPDEFISSLHHDPFTGSVSSLTNHPHSTAKSTVTVPTVEKSIYQLNQTIDEIRSLMQNHYTNQPINQYFNPVTISALVMQYTNQPLSSSSSFPSSFVFDETDTLASLMASLRSGARQLDIFGENILMYRMYRQLFFRSSLVIHLLSLAEECIIMITLTTKMIKELRKTFRYVGGNDRSTGVPNDGFSGLSSSTIPDDPKYNLLGRIYGEKLRLILGLQVARIILLRSIVSLLQVAAFDSEGLDDRTILCNPRPLNLLRFVNCLVFDVLSTHLDPELYVPPHRRNDTPDASSPSPLSPRDNANKPKSSTTGPLTRLVRNNNRRHKDTHNDALNQGIHPLSYERTSHTFGIGPPSLHDVHKTSSVPPFCYTPYDTGSIDIKAALKEVSTTVSRTRLDYARKMDEERLRQEEVRKQEKLRARQDYIKKYGDDDGFEESYQQKLLMVPLSIGSNPMLNANSSTRNIVTNETKTSNDTIEPLYYSRPRTPELLGLTHVLKSSPIEEEKRRDTLSPSFDSSTLPWMGDDVVVPLKRNAEHVLAVKVPINRRSSNGNGGLPSTFSDSAEGFRVSTTSINDRTRTHTSLDSRNYTDSHDPSSPLPLMDDEDNQSIVSLVAADDDDDDDENNEEDEFFVPDDGTDDNYNDPEYPVPLSNEGINGDLGVSRLTTATVTNKLFNKLRKSYGSYGLEDNAIAYVLEGRQAGKDLRDASVALLGDIIYMVIEYNKVHDTHQRNIPPYQHSSSSSHTHHHTFGSSAASSSSFLGRLAVTVRYGDEPNVFAQTIDNVTVLPFASSSSSSSASHGSSVSLRSLPLSGGSVVLPKEEEESGESENSDDEKLVNTPHRTVALKEGTNGTVGIPRSIVLKSSRTKTVSSSSSSSSISASGYPSVFGIIPMNSLAKKNLNVIDTLALLPSSSVMKYLKYIAQEIRRLLTIADKAKKVWLLAQRRNHAAVNAGASLLSSSTYPGEGSRSGMDTSIEFLSSTMIHSTNHNETILRSAPYRLTLQPYSTNPITDTTNTSNNDNSIRGESSESVSAVPTTPLSLPVPVIEPSSTMLQPNDYLSNKNTTNSSSNTASTFSSASIIPPAKPTWSSFTKSIRSVFSTATRKPSPAERSGSHTVADTPFSSSFSPSVLSSSSVTNVSSLNSTTKSLSIDQHHHQQQQQLYRYTDHYHDKQWRQIFNVSNIPVPTEDVSSPSPRNNPDLIRNDYRIHNRYRNPIYAIRLFTHVQTLYSLLHTSSSLTLSSDPSGQTDPSSVLATGQFRNTIITMLRVQLRHFIPHNRLIHIFHYEHIIFAEIIRMLDEIKQML